VISEDESANSSVGTGIMKASTLFPSMHIRQNMHSKEVGKNMNYFLLIHHMLLLHILGRKLKCASRPPQSPSLGL
jgi:hypothetical protein